MSQVVRFSFLSLDYSLTRSMSESI